jgi:branched-chain amino acid transport system permease protein
MTAVSQTGAPPIRASINWGERLKDAVAAAALAALLCVPIILLQAKADSEGFLHPVARPWPVAIFAFLAFFGRLAILNFAAEGKRERVAKPAAVGLRAAIARVLPPVGLVALFVYPVALLLILGSGRSLKWVDSYGIQILIYVMLGWGLNIVVGLAGLLDLGYVAFYAVGAYAYGLLATTFGLSFWFCLPLAGVLAALWGVILGFPVLRLRGDYLAIVTLAFGEIIRTVLVNWVDFTGGGAGIDSIPKITFFGLRFADAPDGFDQFLHLSYSPLHGKMFLYYVILCLALVTNLVSMRLRRLPIGRAWEALREDEIACRSLGVNTTNTKLTAFALGAFFAGLAGSFFAVRQGFISPESFTFTESATILAIVVLGGMGSQIGVALAAVFLIGGFELLRELDFLRAAMSDGTGVLIICLGVFIFGLVRVRRIAGQITLAMIVAVLALRFFQILPTVIVAPFGIADFDPAQYRGLLFGLAMVVMMVVRPRGFVSNRTPSIFLKEKKIVSADLVKEGHG